MKIIGARVLNNSRGFVRQRGVVSPTTQRGSCGIGERERGVGISRKVLGSGVL